MNTLLDPIQIGDLHLPNRMIMAPLTRCRASAGRVPNTLMAEYYRQRASAGLIISEATSVCPMGVGYANTPGIWSADQVEGWKLTTSAVHSAGGRIFLQLWHVGRISDPMFLNGELPVALSAIAPDGHVSLVRPKIPFVTPRALDRQEIQESSKRIARERRMPNSPDSTAWKFMERMAIFLISFCRMGRIAGRMTMEEASKIALVSCSRWLTRPSRSGDRNAWECIWLPDATPIRWVIPIRPTPLDMSPRNSVVESWRSSARASHSEILDWGPCSKGIWRPLHRQREIHVHHRPRVARSS